MTDMRCHRVYKSVDKRLTVSGAERRLFFMALVITAATFNFFGSDERACDVYGLYLFARGATITDPEILRILLNSSKFKRRYDPAKPAARIFGRTD